MSLTISTYVLTFFFFFFFFEGIQHWKMIHKKWGTEYKLNKDKLRNIELLHSLDKQTNELMCRQILEP